MVSNNDEGVGGQRMSRFERWPKIVVEELAGMGIGLQRGRR